MKNYIISFCLLLFLCSCSDDEFKEIDQSENLLSTQSRVQIKRGSDVSKIAIDFIKTKTNNTFTVSSKKGSVKLNNSILSSKNDEFGTVDTSKEIVVVNEDNTKHTFKVITPSESLNTITNLIVVEKENNSYEYFLKYTFVGEIPRNEETNTIDFSRFNGSIETFDADGTSIGFMTIESGIVIDDSGQLNPCLDDTSTEPTNDDNGNTGSNTGGSDSSVGIPNVDEPNEPLSTGNGDLSQSGQFTDPNNGCGLSWSYLPCGCGGSANGHAPQAGVPCCQGSPLVIRDCNGTIIAQRNSNTSTTIFKRTGFDPCNDGDVGVILDDEELCTMDDESFNAYYSSKSPFTVDMSEVRRYCDTIGIPNAENEKFMCIYNKLIKSPKFKHLFTDVFGESQNINVTFNIQDQISSNQDTKAICKIINGTTDGNGNLINLNMEIKIKREHLNNDSRISVAKSIIHECIHAYLNLKRIDCNQGTNFDELNNKLFGELINEYYDGICADTQEGHEFMFDYMLPSMQGILSDVRDNFIPESHRQIVEAYNFQSQSNPVVPSTPWNWDQFYYYFSLVGLHNTAEFQQQIATDPIKNYIFNRYNVTSTLFSNSYCED